MSSAATARLVWERPNGEHVEFPLEEETIVVGREDATIQIELAALSKMLST